MSQLAERRSFAKKFGIRYVEGLWPYLEIDHPAGIVRLVGEAKQDKQHAGQVFLRGQVSHHEAMLPSLFRGSDIRLDWLREAEKDLTERIRRLPPKRFRRDNLPALLQHYGFRTSWLDVVDNLFVAIWFATNELRRPADSCIEVAPSSQEYGWLYLIAENAGPERLKCVDLRTEHHPLSSRPHVQHGISLSRSSQLEYDLRDFVVATVRFPAKFSVAGSLFGGSFLFPPPEVDNTLKLLLGHHVNDIAAGIEKQHGLEPYALGHASSLRDEV